MKNDLSKLKAGDKVFHAKNGEKEIDEILNEGTIVTADGSRYLPDGRLLNSDKHPTLFESLDSMIEYFTEYRRQKRISGKEAFRLYREGKGVKHVLHASSASSSINGLKGLIDDCDSDELNWERT